MLVEKPLESKVGSGTKNRSQGGFGGELMRAESNFEEWAIGLPSRRSSGREHKQEREVMARVGDREVLMRQSWTIQAGGSHDLPGQFDQDVYYALLCVVESRGGMPENGTISFSLREVLGVLGRGYSGRDYEQLVESLNRLSATTYLAKSAFYSSKRRRRVSATLSLLSATVRETSLVDDEGEVIGGAPLDAEARRSLVRFDARVVESYREGYLTSLDPEVYFGLPSGLPRRLYRIIEGSRGESLELTRHLFDLRDRIPLSPESHPSRSAIERRLEPAHQVLVRRGYLRDVFYEGRGPERIVRYGLDPEYVQARLRTARKSAGHSPEELVARERLLAEGVSLIVANRLISQAGPESVLSAADLLANTPAGSVGNPAGWLVRAIERGYRPEPTIALES